MQSSEVRAISEHAVVHAFRVFEIGGVLEVAGDAVRRKAAVPFGIVTITVCRLHFFFTFVWWERDVLRPKRRVDSILENQMRTHV